MSFSYNILSHDVASAPRGFPLLPEGGYSFYVDEAKFSYSKNGNPMITIKLVIDHEGKEFFVFDYLLATEGMGWKVRKFCEAVDLTDAYEAGAFNEHLCVNRRGKVLIGINPERPKNDGSGQMYKAKNEVLDYLERDAILAPSNYRSTSPAAQGEAFAPPRNVTPAKPQPMPQAQFDDSELPF